MEKKYASGKGKIKAFFKKNVYYIIMGVCILAIAAMVTVAVVASNNQDGPTDPVINDQQPDDNKPTENPDDNKPTEKPDDNKPTENPDPIVFGMPVASADIIKDYAMDSLVFSQTLQQYQVHNGIDFGGEEGTAVLAVYDGTVADVTYDVLNGHVVKIDHGDGLVSYYGSLAEPTLKKGDVIKKGATIGTMSTSATSEMADGAHVHFAVYLNGNVVSPYDYLPVGDK